MSRKGPVDYQIDILSLTPPKDPFQCSLDVHAESDDDSDEKKQEYCIFEKSYCCMSFREIQHRSSFL